MARRGEAATLAADVWTRLRREVLDGVLAPGERLKPAELAERFGVSNGVVREALTRLGEQGLVASVHNQGFRVISVSSQHLADLTEFRITVEQLALRMAMSRGDLTWESDVVAAHHRLTATPRRDLDRPDVTTEAWASAHHDFHATLIAACGYGDLLEQCARLSDRAELYRRWSAPASRGKRDVDAEHAALAQAVLARDVDRAVGLLRDHYQRTAVIVQASGLLEHDDASDAAAPGPVPADDRRSN